MQEEIRRSEEVAVARALRLLAVLSAFAAPGFAHASFLSGEALDTAANVLSWVVIVLVPIVAIGLFLFVHVLPEKIAEKRHHPQKESIKVLCILSLFFGGMLWPFAWLWAYTRPVAFRSVYGTERHEDYYFEEAEKARKGQLSAAEVAHLRHELEVMDTKGALSPKLAAVLDELNAIATAPPVVSQPAPAKAANAPAGGGA